MIPYFDTTPEPRYCIVIEKHPKENLENILLVVYKSDEPEKHYLKKIGERKLIKFETKKHEEVTYKHGDLRPREKIIVETDNDIKNGKINLNN